MAHLAYLACWTKDEMNDILELYKNNIPPSLPSIVVVEEPKEPSPIPPKNKKSKKKRYSRKLEFKDLFRREWKTSRCKEEQNVQLPPINLKLGSKNNPIDLTAK